MNFVQSLDTRVFQWVCCPDAKIKISDIHGSGKLPYAEVE